MNKKNGGSAFPVQPFTQGMTLRDYFAASAMQGMVAASGNQSGVVDYDDGLVAESCYQLADAMLKARGGA